MEIIKYVLGPIEVNTYLCYDESGKGFVVDPGTYSQTMVSKIREKNIELEYMVLTHGHGDHIGGVLSLKEEFPKSKIVAYFDEKEMLNSARINASTEIFRNPIEFDADIYVTEGDTLKVGNTELSFIFTPGHTKGGMCVLAGNVLFSGDTMFRESVGRTDFYGGDYGQLVSSIKDKLFILPDDTKVLPGHMEESTIEHEKRYNPFV